MTDVGDVARLSPSPWARWGWATSAIWLLFLAFPITDLLGAGRPGWQQGLGLALLLTFAAVYLHAFTREYRGSSSGPDLSALGHLVLMSVLTLALLLIDTDVGAGTLPFIGAIAVFTLRWATAGVAVAVVVATPVGLAASGLAERGILVLSIISACVAIVCGLVRFIDARDDVWRRARRDYDILAERERVARDVHDVLGHSLTVLAAKAELAERVLDTDPERTREELRQIQSLTRESIAEIRATVAGLRVARLGDELASARRALQDAGVEADVPTTTDAVDPRHRLVLAWVLREAVTNVVRHAGASRCRVELADATLRVSDDGGGVDGVPEGNGLRGIRERVASAGGTVTVGSGVDGRGTTLEVRL